MATDRERQLESLIGLVYDAVTAPDGWTTALDAIREAIGGEAGCLFFQDRVCDAGCTDIETETGYPDDAPAQYLNHFAAVDVRVSELAKLPHLSVYVDDIDIDYSLVERSEIHNDFFRPIGLGRGAGICLFGEKHRSGWLTVHRKIASGLYRMEEVALLRQLAPHVRRSLQLQRQLSQAQAVCSGLASGLNHFQMAVVLVKRNGQVLWANMAANALLTQPDCPLRLNGTRLSAVRATDAVAVHRLIDRICTSLIGDGGAPPDLLRLPGRTGDGLFGIMGAPVRRSEVIGAFSEPLAIIFVSHSVTPIRTDQTVLTRHLGLSPAEAAVAADLVSGARVEDIARRRGVSLETIRSQIKTTLAKTQTQSQPQLIGLISRSLAVLTRAN